MYYWIAVTCLYLCLFHVSSSLSEDALVNNNKRIFELRDGAQSFDVRTHFYFLNIGSVFNTTVNFTDNVVISINDTTIEGQAVRLEVSSPSSQPDFPVFFTVREQRSVLSWQVPIFIKEVYDFYSVSRTLCPMWQNVQDHVINVDVSTMSVSGSQFSLKVDAVSLILSGSNNTVEMTVSPAKPAYYEYHFPPNVWSVVVRATDKYKSRTCAVLSVQNVKCPVHDLIDEIELVGNHQTITTQGAITVTRETYNVSFFIVVAVKPNDYDCLLSERIRPSERGSRGNPNNRTKTLEIVVTPSLTSPQFIAATMAALGFFLLFYFISAIAAFIYHARHKSSSVVAVTFDGSQGAADETRQLLGGGGGENVERAASNTYGTNESRPANAHVVQRSDLICHQRTGSSSSSEISVEAEVNVELLHDVLSSKNIVRTKTNICVADLSKKPRRILDKKYNLYIWNLITLTIFYVLPVIQLVITYQSVVNKTGNEDICWYNFLCAHRVSFLTSFNNVYSNIGYIMLGILFVGLVFRRHRLHNNYLKQRDPNAEECGIPQHFGVFYALGIALAMEGILSGCYHVCPSYNNFQFDTAFMYMIGWLCMIKIYQTRHPDVNAHAHTAYCIIAFIVFMGVMGVTQGSVTFWIVFLVFYVVCVFVLSIHIYYIGRWRLAFATCRDCFALVRGCHPSAFSKPLYMDRMVLLVLGNVVNWIFAAYGAVTMPQDFASYLLAIIIINLLMYFAYYILMKWLRCRERILLQPLFFIIAAAGVWAFALYFFMVRLTSWQVSPAMSRESNEACILFDFYDSHDIWHFLSATSLFLSFMALLTLEDDLVDVPRSQIAVF